MLSQNFVIFFIAFLTLLTTVSLESANPYRCMKLFSVSENFEIIGSTTSGPRNFDAPNRLTNRLEPQIKDSIAAKLALRNSIRALAKLQSRNILDFIQSIDTSETGTKTEFRLIREVREK